MSEREDEQENRATTKPRLNLTTSQVAASALAACCASVVASYLGVAGTVIGAAVGSVVATTGAAIWGHLFHRGGEKIKQTLLINGELVEVEQERSEAPKVPAGRFYSANAADLWTPKDATAETRAIRDDETRLLPGPQPDGPNASGAQPDAPGGPAEPERRPSRLARILKYRKPMGIAAAIVAVFSVSIVVGMLVGAPVRSVGSSNAPSTTTTTTVTETTQGNGGSSQSANSTTSTSPGATSSSSASSSSSATSTPSTSSSASPSASTATSSAATASSSPQAQGATSTGSP